MTEWSLPRLLAGLHDDIEHSLQIARDTLGHPTVKGDGSAAVWLKLFEIYLPRRYCAGTAHVVDSKGAFSEQIDVAIYDRQYSPLIFHYRGQIVMPAESLYAVLEAKQTLNAHNIDYAQKCTARTCRSPSPPASTRRRTRRTSWAASSPSTATGIHPSGIR